jgi:hypothetical protein
MNTGLTSYLKVYFFLNFKNFEVMENKVKVTKLYSLIKLAIKNSVCVSLLGITYTYPGWPGLLR